MDNNKPWYASQTVWGGISAIGGGLGTAWLGYTMRDPVTMGAGLTAAFGGLQSIIGRFKADTPIGKPVAAK